jgi:hypothetical protein
MQLINRQNVPKAPRFPDAKLPPEVFNRAAVEIFKQQYREIVALRNSVHKMEKEMERLDAKAKQGSRPPIRYSNALEEIN